jgi:excisionase family DNA binding protein
VPEHQEFMTVDDLARLLRVPKATIYRWRSTGHSPRGYTIGRHVRFRRAEVEAWLEERADEE